MIASMMCVAPKTVARTVCDWGAERASERVVLCDVGKNVMCPQLKKMRLDQVETMDTKPKDFIREGRDSLHREGMIGILPSKKVMNTNRERINEIDTGIVQTIVYE